MSKKKYFAPLLIAGISWATVGTALGANGLCTDVDSCYQQVNRENIALDTRSLPQVASNGFGRRYANSVFPKQINTSGRRMFVFSPRYKIWAAYNENGRRIAHGVANGGGNYCPDLGHACHTPGGTYAVYSKGTAECISRKFPVPEGGAPMPYCMYFHGGYAIHGSPQISNVNGSHGCIRVTTAAAHWLHENFIDIGTKVKILSY